MYCQCELLQLKREKTQSLSALILRYLQDLWNLYNAGSSNYGKSQALRAQQFAFGLLTGGPGHKAAINHTNQRELLYRGADLQIRMRLAYA